MKKFIVMGVVLTSFAVLGISFAGVFTARPSAQIVPIVQQVAELQLAQVPSPCEFGTPIHITVAGTPLAGSYTACEGHSGSAHRRYWGCGFTNAAGDISGTVFVQRDEPDVQGNISWSFTAMIGPVASRPGGAFAGKNDPSGANFPPWPLGGMSPMTGPDFNGSGTAAFVGTPAYGAGGTITVTVSP